VRTWLDNVKQNGGEPPDPTDERTIDELMEADVTTPRFMRIPVCSAERAWQSWENAGGIRENYPCDAPLGRDECGDELFENQTSDASANVEDCWTIIRNIEGDLTTSWTTQVVGENQREIASHGTCNFGVEATSTDGNVEFRLAVRMSLILLTSLLGGMEGAGRSERRGT
jgi:hypothetical protein